MLMLKTVTSRIRRHLADPESHHRRIAAGFLWVSMFVFVGKLASAAKEMAIAWRYGVSATVDAYAFLFNIINWPVAVCFSILTVVLVPLVAKARYDSPAELPAFRGELLGFALMLGTGSGLACIVCFPFALHRGWAGLSGPSLQQALTMSGPLSLLLPLGLLVSLFSAWLMACGHHRNTLLEAVPAIAILIAVLLSPAALPEALVCGTVAGYALQVAGLGWLLARVSELQAPKWGFTSPAWRDFWNGVGIMVLGQVLMSVTGVLDQFFAAGLGPGALSTLSYANRLLSLILSMGAMAIGRATLPIFSEMQATCATKSEVNALALKWATWVFAAGAAVMAIGWFASPYMVRILFERGAFTSNETAQVSTVLQWGLLQVPAYGFTLTLVNALASSRRYGVFIVSGVVGIVVKLVALLTLLPLMHLNGLVLSAAAVYLATAILFAVAIKRG